MDILEEYTSRIIKVLVYIEEHIEEKMSMDELAGIACYSPFHFHRVFQLVVGETLYRYIKRTRLDRAAVALRYSDRSVTDIALEACFETSSSFAKAFRQMKQTSPGSFRLQQEAIIALKQTIQELPMVEVEAIEEIKDIDILFVRKTGSYEESPRIAWETLLAFLDKKGVDHKTLRKFSLSHDDPNVTEKDHLRFDACVEVPAGLKAEGEVGQKVLKGGAYITHTHHGPYEGLRVKFNGLIMKWIPENGKSYDDTRIPFCECFNQEYVRTDPSKLITKIYIPIHS